jgi:single-strand DNA-binding protein
MARDLNKAMLTGRLSRDPLMRVTPQGHTITRFVVAVNHTWTTADGQRRDLVEWAFVVAWNRLGEICAAQLRRGSHVYVEGRFQTRFWTDAQSGQPRSRTEIIAAEVIALDDEANGEPPEPSP